MSSLTTGGETLALRARLHDFCFPHGDQGARPIKGVRVEEHGEIRASAEAKWTPFTAGQTIEVMHSGFRWEAHVGPVTFVDAYERGHGVSAVQPPGGAAVEKATGPEIDQAALQRYLASIPLCPPILLNHHSLTWTASGPLTLRVRDLEDPTGATVDLDLDEQGRPASARATRARMAGREMVMTPWRGVYSGFRDWEGMLIPTRIEVYWGLEAGEFQYFWSEATSLELL